MQPQISGSLLGRSSLVRRLLLAAAALAYMLAIAGAAAPELGATALSALAIAALGVALFVYVAARVKQPATVRLGARAQSARRHYRNVAALSLGVVYITLVVGALVANQSALRACLALPFCAVGGADASRSLAMISIGHRVLAALAAVLVIELAYRTWRTRPERPVRRAATWALCLMALQILIGAAQVVLAAGEAGGELSLARGAHLAIGIGAWGALVVQVALALYLPTADHRPPTTSGVLSRSAVGSRWSAVVKDYISLTKPGVITLLIFTTVASMYITPAGTPPLALVLWTFLGGWLMASGAHAVNCWADQDIDINMGRTSRRPVPSGRIPAWHALALGVALGAIAFAILALMVNLPAALLSLAGYLYYVFIYTRWLKRTTPSNIVIGGGAGAFPPLVGWAAATGGLTLPSLFLFAIIFYWTPPHFWALALIREKDYARASVPMLPVVAGDGETKRQIVLYTLLMLALTVMPTPLRMLGLPYLAMAAALGAVFMGHVIRLWRTGTTAAAWGLYKFSLLYLFLLFVAMVIDRVIFA